MSSINNANHDDAIAIVWAYVSISGPSYVIVSKTTGILYISSKVLIFNGARSPRLF